MIEIHLVYRTKRSFSELINIVNLYCKSFYIFYCFALKLIFLCNSLKYGKSPTKDCSKNFYIFIFDVYWILNVCFVLPTKWVFPIKTWKFVVSLIRVSLYFWSHQALAQFQFIAWSWEELEARGSLVEKDDAGAKVEVSNFLSGLEMDWRLLRLDRPGL